MKTTFKLFGAPALLALMACESETTTQHLQVPVDGKFYTMTVESTRGSYSNSERAFVAVNGEYLSCDPGFCAEVVRAHLKKQRAAAPAGMSKTPATAPMAAKPGVIGFEGAN